MCEVASESHNERLKTTESKVRWVCLCPAEEEARKGEMKSIYQQTKEADRIKTRTEQQNRTDHKEVRIRISGKVNLFPLLSSSK